MLDAEKIQKVVDCILKKELTISEINQETGFSERTIQNYIKALNNPKYSNVFNPELYDKVREKQIEIGKERKKSGGSKGKKNVVTSFNKDLAIANLILANNLTIEQAASKMQVDPNLLYNLLVEIKEEKLKEKLGPILKFYKKGKLSQLPHETQIEIILMALTFRVSFKTLITMFNTTQKDLLEMLANFKNLEYAIKYLDLETKNEDEINERVAYVHAKNYWSARNKLLKKLNETIACNNKKEIEKLKFELKNLRNEIDDTQASKIANKKFKDLTTIERNIIARYRLKYKQSRRISAEIFHFNVRSIEICEKELAQTDKIYAEKIDFLNSLNFNQFYATLYQKNREGQSADITKSFMKSLNTNSEFFEDAIAEAKSTRGGGTR